MRVTHVITRLIVGGAQENTISSVLGLRSRSGVTVELISGPTTGPEGSLESLLTPFPALLRIATHLVRPVHPVCDWAALRELTGILRHNRPDIVHTHSGKAGVLGRLAAARAGVPVIVHTIHGPSFGAFQGRVANMAFRAAERRAARVTRHFVVVADAMKEQYLAAGIGEPRQYTRIFSGFSLDPFLNAQNDPVLRSRLGLAQSDLVVGMIARLTDLKGHEDLFAAAPGLVKAWPNMKFLLVGNGSWRQRLEEQARGLGLGNHFVFAGLVPPTDVPRLIGIMDILVHLSRREGLPRALPQALAASRPVVAFDCDGAREVCLENETGFLLNPADVEGLTRRLLQLARDPGLRERFGRAGREYVRPRFGVEQMVEQLHRLYLRLLSEAGLDPLSADEGVAMKQGAVK